MFTASQPILDVSDHRGLAVPDCLCLMTHVPVILDSAIEDISFPAESSVDSDALGRGKAGTPSRAPGLRALPSLLGLASLLWADEFIPGTSSAVPQGWGSSYLERNVIHCWILSG